MSKSINKKTNKIKHLVVHISDSPDSMDIGVHEIREWHKARNFKDIGYHFVVARCGSIQKGRDLFKKGHKGTLRFNPGAHVKGSNSNSIGICLVGRNKATTSQKISLIMLLRNLMNEFGLDVDNVVGHAELAPNSGKTCPAPMIDMTQLRADLIFKSDSLNWDDFQIELSKMIGDYNEKNI